MAEFGPADDGYARAAPVFFLSYARPPQPADARGAGADLFDAFFEDLKAHAAELLGRRDPDRVGHAADSAAPDEETARALSSCHVFVPLISPLYFSSRWCGVEWTAFAKRAAGTTPARNFAPVVWAPVPVASVPRKALDATLPLTARDERPDTFEGLYGLMLDPGRKADYRSVVEDVARSIYHTAQDHPLPPRVRPLDLGEVGSAFDAPSSRPPLRVVILAPTTGRLPAHRTAEGHYGPAQTDWAPYGGQWGRTLAQDAETVAGRLGYAPEVIGFDHFAQNVHAGTLPPAPTVLLIDNWALLDDGWRARLAAYISADNPGLTYMIIRDDGDAETHQRGDALRAVVNETLSESLQRMRIDVRHAASGNGSRQRFPSDFSVVAELAAGRFRKSR